MDLRFGVPQGQRSVLAGIRSILAGLLLVAAFLSACSLLIASQEKGPRSCSSGSECLAGHYCIEGTCRELAPGECLDGGICGTDCSNGIRDGQETDVDCGGPCAKCPDGKKCAVDPDCGSGSCVSGICGLPCGVACGVDEYCDPSGQCTRKRDNAAACDHAGQCKSGNCADGFCCDSACAGGCDACNLSGHAGSCSPMPLGNAGDPSCALYVCDGTSLVCPTHCATNDLCQRGSYCGEKGECVSLASDLLGYWTLDAADLSGGVAQDRSPFGSNGVLYGFSSAPVTGPGVIGQALAFDGGDQRIALPASEALDLSSSSHPTWTIAAWISPKLVAGMQFPVIYSYGHWYASLGLADSSGSAKGTLEGWLNNNQYCNSTTVVPLNAWTHVALVRRETGSIDLYINGSLSGSCLDTLIGSDSSGSGIGNIADGGAIGGFAGWIDEVRLYSRALSDADLKGLFLLR